MPVFAISEHLQLWFDKAGWKLIFCTPKINWLVQSTVLLEVHGSTNGKLWSAQIRDFETVDEKVELIEGIGMCRVISFQGLTER